MSVTILQSQNVLECFFLKKNIQKKGVAKGHLISKRLFVFLILPKNERKISALVG